METDIKTDVLIVGAGPTGLSLAAQLLRYGVEFAICDKKEGTTDLSKALVVHARTLEIYDQIGLARPAVAGGEVVQNAVMMHGGETKATLDFADIGGRLSPFPFMLMFEQSKNERLLNGHLQDAGKAVRWQTELTSLTQDEAGVRATLKAADGQAQTVEARYLIGCDGAGSATRHLLGVGFGGSTFPRLFYVADVGVAFEGEHDSVYASFEADSFLLLFPMQDADHWRLIGPLPEYEQTLKANPDHEANVSFAEVELKITALMGHPLDIRQVHWFSTYKVHTRHAEAFRRGRCFLAGDAAHVHTPAGGQGMNTGIQDAYNLAWKLALVLGGRAGDALLDTYNLERLANAKHLLQTTDQFFDVAAGDTWQQRLFRDHILPGLAGFAWKFETAREIVFPALSQIGIHYPDSPLSRHVGDGEFKAKAGDRMPYFAVEDTGIYDRLHAPCLHLLAFSDGTGADGSRWAQIADASDGLMDFHALPLSPEAAGAFGSDRPFWVLLRPDNYIGLVSHALSEDGLAGYLHACLTDQA